tara:strand:- start:1387 stop:1617 length:231 start_codon:yes stop_codon:yes gene_type:complete
MTTHFRHLKAVKDRLEPKYKFDNNESIFTLAKRMDADDWNELKNAIKYPNGKLRLAAENELLLQQQAHQASEDENE